MRILSITTRIAVLLAFAIPMQAQITRLPDEKRQKQNPKNDQWAIDEQLANQHLKNQEYDKAQAIYKQLYDKSKQTHYFQQYVDCTIQLKQYAELEKELKSFIKSHPEYPKSLVDLIYVYTLDNKADKAEKQFSEILKNLPENASLIRNIGFQLQSRSLYDMAMRVFEKGNSMLSGKETFYMEQANINQSRANYQEAFRYYFLELEKNPGQYNNIKNRLQTMLFYDVNNSIRDELRIALLKRTQE